MYDFEYHRPKSVADAVSLLKSKPEARAMSGGMTLIPTLKQRLARPSDVVDLGGVKELAGIKIEGNNVVVGGMTRHADVAGSAEVKAAIPALAYLAGHIGAQPRHDRRLDRQQRSGSRLSGCGRGIECHGHHQYPQDRC